MELTDQQIKFAKLLRDQPDMTAKQAALLAGCAPSSAASLASRWKKYPKVHAIISGGHGESVNDQNIRVSSQSALASTEVLCHDTSSGAAFKLFTPPPHAPEAKALNPRHQRFCQEFLVDENGTQAYLRAYPTSSYESARRSAHDLLTNPDILARIEELREERNRRLNISADRILSVLARQAFYDPRELFDADWRLKPFDELPPDVAFIISSFTTKATVTGEEKDGICVITNVKLADKTKAAELLGRHQKLFTDKIEVTEDTAFARRLGVAVEEMKKHGKRH